MLRCTMLFESISLGSLTLSNRVVMAPMTRSRATADNIPTPIVATYYAQRASAGLLITEGTSPSPNGVGYVRIPGLYNERQVAAWRTVTNAVHERGGKIVVQLMHTGRVTSTLNLPAGARVVAPTDEVCPGQMYTDTQGMQPHSQPHAMTQADIDEAVVEYANAARHAMAAGFDGIELHGANGYLIEQFLNGNVNKRTDGYGGPAGRNRFALEVARACAEAIGANKIGMRLSPYGVFNGTGPFDGLDAQYVDLARELSSLGLMYLHVLDHSGMGAPPVPATIKAALRDAFRGTFILGGGFTSETAEAALVARQADLIAFGRPFISNPDLVTRMAKNLPLAKPEMRTFYTPGEAGYIDYPSAS